MSLFCNPLCSPFVFIQTCGKQVTLDQARLQHEKHVWYGTDECFACAYCSESLLGLPYLPKDGQVFFQQRTRQAIQGQVKEIKHYAEQIYIGISHATTLKAAVDLDASHVAESMRACANAEVGGVARYKQLNGRGRGCSHNIRKVVYLA